NDHDRGRSLRWLFSSKRGGSTRNATYYRDDTTGKAGRIWREFGCGDDVAANWAQLVGDNARKHRQRLGLTQARVAKRAKIDANYYGILERGKGNPSLSVIVAIAGALGVDPAHLFAPLK